MENQQIELRDIAVCVQLIDRAVERGIIKGNELTVVGAVRDKFAAAVEAAQKQAAAEQEVSEEATAE